MKPVVMTAGKKAGHQANDDTLNLDILFPRMQRPERAEIELTNGEEPRIRITAGPGIKIETALPEKTMPRKRRK